MDDVEQVEKRLLFVREPSVAASVQGLQQLDTEGRKTPAFEDAWMGFSIVGLLPPDARRRIVLFMMHPHFFFDAAGFVMNNTTMVVHWPQGKAHQHTHLCRMRAAHAHSMNFHCPTNATHSCQSRSHATNWAKAYPSGRLCRGCSAGASWTVCGIGSGNTTCTPFRSHAFRTLEVLKGCGP